jgi:hypothetical protein
MKSNPAELDSEMEIPAKISLATNLDLDTSSIDR